MRSKITEMDSRRNTCYKKHWFEEERKRKAKEVREP